MSDEKKPSAWGLDNPAFVSDGGEAPPAAAPSDSSKSGEPKAAERQQWGSGLEFLMSCIAMSVGLGNVWRFPYTAYKNGGGAFLIPYIIVLIIIGRPLYYLEMGLGQFTSRSCVKIWNMIPALKGVGYGQMFATACVLSYYCSLMALTLFYLGCSFQAELPWSKCRPEWNISRPDVVCVESGGEGNYELNNSKPSSELFFKEYVLHEKRDLSDGIGLPDWRLTLCLAGAWILILVIMIRGVKSSGKVAYFLALFPYLVMTILLIRGATLPGAKDGIIFFVKPQWDKLLDAQVWYAAVTQAFFSLNVGFGTLIVYSSYNDFRHGIYRDAMIVTTLDTFTSLLAGCTIFSILGNLAKETKQNVKDVVDSGPGLAYISYPDAIAKFEQVPQLFSVLFFLMLLTLGLGSAVALQGAIVAIVNDTFPKLRLWMVNVCVSCAGFLIGLVYVTPAGQWLLDLVDHFGATFPVLALMCVEMGGVAWIYGLNNICDDMRFMLNRRSGIYWRLTWGLITPVFLLVVLIYAAVEDEPLTYNGVDYPDHYYIVGWLMMAVPVALCPGWALYEIFKRWKGRSFVEALFEAFRPSAEWGPAEPLLLQEWKEEKERVRRVMAERNLSPVGAIGACLCSAGTPSPRASVLSGSGSSDGAGDIQDTLPDKT